MVRKSMKCVSPRSVTTTTCKLFDTVSVCTKRKLIKGFLKISHNLQVQLSLIL